MRRIDWWVWPTRTRQAHARDPRNNVQIMERYFKPACPAEPAPRLSGAGASRTIKQANKHVDEMLSRGKRRQEYEKVSTELKTKAARYAAENGVKAAVMKFQGQVPNAPKNCKNTVCDWKYDFLRQLQRKRKAGDLDDVVLLVKKRGRPLKVGEVIDKQVQAYITELRKAHATINTAIVISAGEDILEASDPSRLLCNGVLLSLRIPGQRT